MKTYTHVLFATDLSEQSNTLGEKTKHIATQFDAKLSIVHVIEQITPIYGSGEFNIPIDAAQFEEKQQQTKLALSTQAKHLNIDEQNQWLINGSKIEEIVELAEKIRVDLIVVGAHDKHGLSLLFSSTSDCILHALPCDVLSMRVDQK